MEAIEYIKNLHPLILWGILGAMVAIVFWQVYRLMYPPGDESSEDGDGYLTKEQKENIIFAFLSIIIIVAVAFILAGRREGDEPKRKRHDR